jgi:hypothetical protein
MNTFIVTLILVTALIVFLKVKKFSPLREKLRQRIGPWIQKCHCDKFACKSSKKDKAEPSAIKRPEIQEKRSATAAAEIESGSHPPLTADIPSPQADVQAATTAGEEEHLAVAAAEEIDEVTVEDIAEYTLEHIAEGTVEAAAETAPWVEALEIQSVPEDSILRRHFLAALRAGIETRIGPRPTDSVLRRHYDSLMDGEMKKRLPEDVVLDALRATEPSGETPVMVEAQPDVRDELPSVEESEEIALEDIAEAAVEPVAAEAEVTVAGETAPCVEATDIPNVPQDSILRRHFLATLRAGIETRIGPRPTDSILRRHYDNLIDGEIKKHLPEAAVGDTCRVAGASGETPMAVQIAAPDETAKPADIQVETLTAVATEETPEAATGPETAPSAEKTVKQRVPQNPVLRRHFVAALRAEIESGMYPRPTDSILRRHYETLLDTEINARLAEMEASDV